MNAPRPPIAKSLRTKARQADPAFDRRIASAIAAGGSPYFVGGCVRDAYLGAEPSDIDIEVLSMSDDTLRKTLHADSVGKSFGVIKINGIDWSASPTEYIRDAAQRRDFTMNAMYVGVNTGTFHDPLLGHIDLQAKRLVIGSAERFRDDPLRVLRGMQFASRFGLTNWSWDTEEECAMLAHEYEQLPKERVFAEWVKWAGGPHPSYGLAFLLECGWLINFPALFALNSTPQDAEWHPEGNAFQHTCYVCDEMARICDRDGIEGTDRTVLMLGALCHDVGKATTTERGQDGRWRSPHHAQAGVSIAEEFLNGIGCFPDITKRVLPLVKEHMVHIGGDADNRTVRRLLLRLAPAKFDDLMLVIEADYSGRPPLPKGMPEGAGRLIALRNALPPKYEPILMGRHLLEQGYLPGKDMGDILRAAVAAQVEGEFTDLEGAMAWLRNRS